MTMNRDRSYQRLADSEVSPHASLGRIAILPSNVRNREDLASIVNNHYKDASNSQLTSEPRNVERSWDGWDYF